MSRAPGWLPDPTRRHELRYWDGGAWTADVADQGVESFDPRPVPVTPPPDAPLPGAAPLDPAADPGYGWAGSTQPGTGVLTPAGGTPTMGPGPTPTPGEAAPGPAWAPGSAPSTARSSRRVLVGLVVLFLVAGVGAVVALAAGDGDGRPSTTARGAGGETSSSAATSSTSTSTTLDPAAAMVDSIVAGVMEQAGDVITQAEAECMALALLDQVGGERLQEVGDAVAEHEGVNPLGLLTPAEQEAALARMRTCVDPAKLDELAPEGE